YLIYSKEIDLNIDTDVNVIFDFNATTNFDINIEAIKIFYHAIGSDDGNCYGWERTVQKCGWKVEDATKINWNIFKQVDGNYLFRSETEDNHAYKPYAYNTDPENFEETDGTYLLSTGDRWARTLLTFVPRDVNTLYNISFSGSYTGTLSRTLNVYDCNTPVSDPLTSHLCNRFSFTSASEKASDGYFIIKQVSNDFNQLVADQNVTINADGNHWIYFNCPNCSAAKYWSIDNITENTNVDRTRNWTSTAGPAAFVASTNTFDTHMHWLKLNSVNYFDFIIQAQDQAGGDHNSQMYRDLISAVNLRPRVSSIYYPVPGNYVKGVIDVNISVVDPYINPIADGVVCDVNILDVNKVPIHSVMFSQAVIICPFCAGYHCVGSFDTGTVADGNYFVYARVRETNTADLYSSDFNTGSPFIVDNTAPSFILVTPTIDTIVYNGLVEFLVFGADAGSKLATCTYSIFEDDILDTNSYAIADSNGQCTISFLSMPGTEVYLTLLKLTDNIGNVLNQLEVSEKYLVMELVLPYEANAEEITDEDLGNIFLYTLYSFVVGGSLSFFWVIGLILTVMALIIILKRGG
ncbi:MAG TPA: hypothetical protein VMW25_04115, partial [Clostridia bacterium]|nr:hypothetical protein [Clostridia bacterium]